MLVFTHNSGMGRALELEEAGSIDTRALQGVGLGGSAVGKAEIFPRSVGGGPRGKLETERRDMIETV